MVNRLHMSNIIGTFVPVIRNFATMARPVSADTANKIIIHTNGGHRYASTKTYATDDSGKKRYAYKHWGTVDEGETVLPAA